MNNVNNAAGTGTPNASAPPSHTAVLLIIACVVAFCIVIIVIIVIAWVRFTKQTARSSLTQPSRPRRILTEKRLDCLDQVAVDLMPICKVARCKVIERRSSMDLEVGDASLQEQSGAPQSFSCRKGDGLLLNGVGSSNDEKQSEASRHVAIATPETMHAGNRYFIKSGDNQQSPRFDDGKIDCAICVDRFAEGESTRVLPCGHDFHPACIDPWLLNVSGKCPLWYVTSWLSSLSDTYVKKS